MLHFWIWTGLENKLRENTVNAFFLWRRNSTMDVVIRIRNCESNERDVTSTADLKYCLRRRRESAVCVRVDQRIVSVSGECTYRYWDVDPSPDSGTRATYRPTSVPCAVLGSRRVNGSNVGPFEVDKVVSWLFPFSLGSATRNVLAMTGYS